MPSIRQLSKTQLQSKVQLLESRLVLLESQLVYGFYENLYPHFIQGSSNTNPLCELITAEQLFMIFHRLRQLQLENWRLARNLSGG